MKVEIAVLAQAGDTVAKTQKAKGKSDIIAETSARPLTS